LWACARRCCCWPWGCPLLLQLLARQPPLLLLLLLLPLLLLHWRIFFHSQQLLLCCEGLVQLTACNKHVHKTTEHHPRACQHP
jgi:hypothetical protein